MLTKKILFSFLFFILLLSCATNKPASEGNIERIDAALDGIVDAQAKIEIIAEGFEWSEGPLWLEEENMLLFSDVPTNTIYKWTEEGEKEIYLQPSGYTGSIKRGGETGSNGLLLNKERKLVICQHGNRQIAQMEAPLIQPQPQFIPIANTYEGKKFNSPNDAVYNKEGILFFTDPPYGLEKNMEDAGKEIPFQGVYKVTTNGTVVLLTDTITRPNGIALTPNEKQIIIANSDSLKPIWYQYDLGPENTLTNGKIFYDATAASKEEEGMPDGLKIDKSGNIFATGPGGVWIFNKDAKLLGKIKFPHKTSNCAFSKDEKTLFVTADNYVLRIKLRE